MPGGKFIPQIEEVLGGGDLEEVKRLTYEALKAMAEFLPQVPMVSTKGNPENELEAEAGSMLAFDQDAGKFYFKESGDIAGDRTRGWKEVQLV